MNILDKIIADKRLQVQSDKLAQPVSVLEKMPGFERATVSLAQAVKNDSHIIAEYKRQSPSKGIINGTATVQDVVSAYDLHGASGMSVLTDTKYFGGTNHDLQTARQRTDRPLLRKDFMIDEYQIIEAKAIGADVILLIAANLTPAEVKRLAAFAHSLRLEVLLELHAEEELAHVCDEVDLVGINNRNLKNFEVNLEHSIRLASQLPAGKPKIAESGIHSLETLLYLQREGFDGFLMGEYFMKQANPAAAFESFVNELKAAARPYNHGTGNNDTA